MNKVILIGRLCADPEVRVTNSGKTVGNFRLAVNRDFKKDETDFFRVTCWGKQAEVIKKYFVKGNQIALTGRIQNNSYEKDGRKMVTTDIILESFDFIGSNNSNSSRQSSKPETYDSGLDDDFSLLADDDDLPF